MPGKRLPALPSDEALGGGMLTFARLRPLDRDVDCRRRIAYEIHGGTDDETEVKKSKGTWRFRWVVLVGW